MGARKVSRHCHFHSHVQKVPLGIGSTGVSVGNATGCTFYSIGLSLLLLIASGSGDIVLLKPAIWA